jgi:hypothetical protein
MKKLLLVAGMLIPAMAFSQSNESGTVQLGLGFSLSLGGATITSTIADSINGPSLGDFKSSGVGARVGYGIKAQYGLAEAVSAGIFLRREAAGYTTDFGDDLYTDGMTTEITTTGLSFGIEGKFYVVNKDRFNLYFGPAIGLTTGSATLQRSGDLDVDGSLSGLNYALGGGLNWYWGDHVGMAFDFGYTGQSLSGEPDDLNDFISPFDPYYYDSAITTKYKVTGGNVFIALSFIAKFGGN